jgi:hypothetical protein
MTHLNSLASAFRHRHTREQMRIVYLLHTGREVPKWANLRQYVTEWHVAQQAINAGCRSSKFWNRATKGTQ